MTTMRRRKERAITADILDKLSREPEVKQARRFTPNRTTAEEDAKTVNELVLAVVGVTVLLVAFGGLLGWLALQFSPVLWQTLFFK